MKTDEFKQNAHLYLGITRREFNRRLSTGLIDIEILKSQIEQNFRETELETACERCLSSQSVDQVDKFEILEDSSL